MKILGLVLGSLLALVLLVLVQPMCACGSGDEPVLDYSTVSVHTVLHGTMPFHTKGRGTVVRIGPRSGATVSIFLSFARNLKIGDPASVKIVGIGGALTGKVTKIGELNAGESGNTAPVPVDLSFDQPLPLDVRAGDSADALIEYGRIENTLYMERGFFNTANTEVAVFRVEPDIKSATRVTVRFGVIASEMIEIKSGLREGDKVIVTDMSRYSNSDRVRIE